MLCPPWGLNSQPWGQELYALYGLSQPGAPELRFCSEKQICIFFMCPAISERYYFGRMCAGDNPYPLRSLGLPPAASPSSFHFSHTGLFSVPEITGFLSTLKAVTFLLLLFPRLFPSHPALRSNCVPSERLPQLQSLSIISAWFICFTIFIGIQS